MDTFVDSGSFYGYTPGNKVRHGQRHHWRATIGPSRGSAKARRIQLNADARYPAAEGSRQKGNTGNPNFAILEEWSDRSRRA
jgi:hypothetical protein